MLPLYAKISRDIRADRRVKIMQSLLLCLLAEITKNIEDIHFSERGIQQLLLDIHFLMLSSTPFLVEQLTTQATETCAVAMRVFKRTNISQASAQLKPEQWLDQQARTLQARYPLDFGQI